jgi:hypothetical protein
MVALGGCLQRYVDPPAPVDEGTFFVHVVKAPDESFPKILTWYTGTTLSQEIVLRYNPVVTQRDLKVGDRIVIPAELVANPNSYGTAPQAGQSKTPNLLMGESPAPEQAPPPSVATTKQVSAGSQSPEPVAAQTQDNLPVMHLETFGEEAAPEPAQAAEATAPLVESSEGKARQLQREIADKQRELDQLNAAQPTAVGDDDMPPPGLLDEYAGS